MKYLYLLTLITLSTLKTYSQSKVERAVFDSCIEEEDAFTCSRDKILEDIYSLINTKHIAGTEQKEGSYITLSLVFVVNHEGNVMPEETEVISSYQPLENSVYEYIKNLPVFIPKNTGEYNNRTLYYYAKVYLFDNEKKSYESVTSFDLIKKGIKLEKNPRSIKPDMQPLHPKCKSVSNPNECTAKMLLDFISKKYRIPYTNNSGQVKMYVILSVGIDGKVEVSDILGGTDIFKNELKRVIKKLPKLEPGVMRGIPIKTGYNLPFTINIT